MVVSKTPNSSNTISITNGKNRKKSEKSDMNDMNRKNQSKINQKSSSIGNEGSKNIKAVSVSKNTKKSTISTGTSGEKEKSLICVMNDMNDMNDFQADLFISNISHITDFKNTFGSGVLESILQYFLVNHNNSVPYEVVANNVGVTTESVRNPINRHKQYFAEGKKDGMKKTIHLSDIGIKYCFNILKTYVNLQNEIKKNLSNKQKEKIRLNEFMESARLLIYQIKPDIIGKKAIIDFKKISEFDIEFANFLLDSPDESLDILNKELQFASVNDIRITNLPNEESLPIEKIRSNHIDRIVSIEGRCVSLSSVRPIITSVKFECPSCGSIISIDQHEKKIKEPNKCSCGRRGGFKVVSKEVDDIARVILEDLQEKTDNANTQRIDCFIRNGLTSHEEISTFTPGEELKITGIVREVKKVSSSGSMDVQMGIIVEINHAEKIEEEVNIDTFTDEELEKFKSLSDKIDKEGIGALTPSFAPEVHGYVPHKNAIMLQCCTKRNEPKSSAVRNKISMLMIGDPGIAKTVLGKFAVAITPHSKMAAGGGSSAVGITASVVKEDESMGGYRVEPGAMVLAKELLFLDEMNNITEDDKPKLQQGMSEQQISINKANLHVNLKVQGGMLATANPIKGHFMSDLPFAQQFNITSPILNRFDAIFVMQDKVDKDRDHAITDIMIKRRRNRIEPEYDKEFLRKFFVFIRSRKEPEIPDSLIPKIQKVYSSSRKNKKADVIINPRFIESLTRFMEASAKLRLADEVGEKDLERALEILSHSHFQTSQYKQFEGELE